MKITAFFLIIACLQVQASGYGQGITLSEKDAPLEKIFKEIRRQTGYQFFYSDKVLERAKRVTIEVKGMKVEEVLRRVFEGQELEWRVKDRTVVVRRKEGGGQQVMSPPVDITGKVTDNEGKPLPGANVRVRGSDLGTITNELGNFLLKNVDNNAVLEISFVGYETQTVSVRGRSQVSINLSQKSSVLDETVIIAYGSTTKKLNTGNIGTVKSTDIAKQPVNNPLLAMQGRVAGLFITQTSGLPGGNVNVSIQGQNSIINGNDPLYVIDGVPYNSQLINSSLARNESIIGSPLSGGSPLNLINPNDIESIEVLKDADATAIYGSRAANGAILITTKKGKSGKSKINLDFQRGLGQVASRLDLLNLRQYLDMRYEAFANDGINWKEPSVVASDLKLWDTSRSTDWQDVFIGGTADIINASATSSGGTANIQYLLSGTYRKETTVFPGDFSNQKASVHFNLNSVSANQKFRIQFSTNFLKEHNKLPLVDMTRAITLAPNAPELYNTDGSINWAQDATGFATWTNPIAAKFQIYNSKASNLVSNAVLNYRIIDGIELAANVGYTLLHLDEYSPFQPFGAYPPEWAAFLTRSANYSNNRTDSWIIEPQAIFKRSFSFGKLEGLVGTTFLENNQNGEYLVGNGYNSDELMKNVRNAASVSVGASTVANYKYNAIFGRLNYNYRDKYLVNLAARRDGSSRFGAANRFENFGSVGIGWIFTNEKFSKSLFSFLSFGKLRGSFGTTGNDQIGDYKYLNLYQPTVSDTSYQGVPGLTPVGFPDPYIQWELTKKLQAGLEAGLLNDRVQLTVNYVYNKSSNQLLKYRLPNFTGFNFIISNFPATVKNNSWEFTIRSVNIKTSEFTWTTNANLTIPKNKLSSFPNLSSSSYANTLIVGQPVNIKRVFNLLGADQNTGEYKFNDGSGNPTANPVYIGTVDINPKFYGGFENSINFKRFQVDFFFHFVKQMGPRFINTQGVPGQFGGGFNNHPTSVLDRWRKPSDNTFTQRFSSGFNLLPSYYLAINSDYGYVDASFIKLRNLSVSYELPSNLIQRIHLTQIRLYVQGQNLLTITNYKGLDPEIASINRTLPPLRIITMGVQVGL